MTTVPFRSLFLCSILAAATLATTACGPIYSRQKYGSPQTQQVSNGASRAEVLANLGQPSSVYRNPDGTEAFFYQFNQGSTILGLIGEVSRIDTVVVMNEGGTVVYAGEVPVGSGLSVPAFPLGGTTPLTTDVLLAPPANYEVEMGQE